MDQEATLAARCLGLCSAQPAPLCIISIRVELLTGPNNRVVEMNDPLFVCYGSLYLATLHRLSQRASCI